MSTYADWTFYSATYLGSAITQAEFPALALRASVLIDKFTYNRAANESDLDVVAKIKNAMCAVADELKAQATQPGGIASERVGNHSVTYATSSEMQLSNQQKLHNVVRDYLWETGLMFASFASGEYGGWLDAD